MFAFSYVPYIVFFVILRIVVCAVTRNNAIPISFSYLITYLLTPYSTVLLEKLTVSQLVKKFSAFYGTLWFITAFTSAHHMSLS